MTFKEAIEFNKNLKCYMAISDRLSEHKFLKDNYKALEMAIDSLERESCDDPGEISDGYHTFNQLYYQRAVLFAALVNLNKTCSWKSWKHADGKFCFDSNGEWFIVGIDTPEGPYTYHYEKSYWDMFHCAELETAKEWDGHTEKDVTRLLSLSESGINKPFHRALTDF